MDEERALRQKLEHKLEKLTNDSGRNPMSHKKVSPTTTATATATTTATTFLFSSHQISHCRSFVPQVGDILNAIYSEKGGGEIMTFGKCQAGHGSVNNQELVELRAKIQLREAQFSDLKAELQRVSESMLEERGTLYERIKTLEDKNTELVNSKTKSDAVGVIIERERALTRCERTEHLAQIDSLRRIISSFRVCCSTGPGQVQQTTQEQHLLLQHQQTDPGKKNNATPPPLTITTTKFLTHLNCCLRLHVCVCVKLQIRDLMRHLTLCLRERASTSTTLLS